MTALSGAPQAQARQRAASINSAPLQIRFYFGAKLQICCSRKARPSPSKQAKSVVLISFK
jgi:hypothetical protein